MRKPWIVLVALAAISSLGVTSFYLLQTESKGWDSTKYASQVISWSSCGENFECGDITVPVDYENLDGERIQLSLVRHPANNKSSRIGTLFVNPGGPGASGVEYGFAAEYIVSPEILAQYDIVGFDPRGVGGSSAERCLTNKETDRLIASNGPPAVGLPESEIIAASKMLAEKCKAKLGDRLKHLGSVDVVRDMELMRKVFGEKKFNYLGKSYGTYLGLVYAAMYPNSVGRVVLDGVIDPQVTTNEVNKTQAIGFELALDSFLTDCITKVNCFYQGDLRGARDEVSKIMSLLRASPLKLNDARLVTESILVLAMVSSLYNTDTGWPELNRAFKDAVKGKGIRLQRMADDYVLRDKNGAYNSNENEIAYIVNCVDREDDASIERTKADSIAISKIAPHFGPYIAWSSLPCDYWPYPPIRPPVELSGPNLPPFLMVGTTRDPATPYEWAQSVAKRFPSGILITADGDGHTGHGRGSACVDDAVDDYLLKGTLPGGALTCTL